jgi:hypothetical protein
LKGQSPLWTADALQGFKKKRISGAGSPGVWTVSGMSILFLRKSTTSKQMGKIKALEADISVWNFVGVWGFFCLFFVLFCFLVVLE